ncbi:MAG: Fe-S cluster assembly protein SufB [Methanobacteriota archaeon]|nr:MAG: Fe-S cluster assembly protein SufB [Euryarchaeota archaeon]
MVTKAELEERMAAAGEYKHGFVADIEEEFAPKGLNEDIVRYISDKKGEPEWLLQWRLRAYRNWLTMKEPKWANIHYGPIDYQDTYYYAAPKKKPASFSEVDPEIRAMYDRLGIPLVERDKLAGVAVDAVFDSVSVATTFKEKLNELGIIFSSFSDAVREHPDLVRKWLGSVVPFNDNFFAALNSAVFSDGSFAYVPPGVRCPMELSTYFRINAASTGQFERTLIIADKGAYVSYLEGCTAPMRDENQLHAAVVELVALDDGEVKYSTIQNWYPGDKDGKGGIYNFVTKRGKALGRNSKISWTQVETGSAITWKYPSCILQGDNSVGEFYSVAVVNNHQQADTGTKMLHIGKNTRSTIISKGISAGLGQNTYRGRVQIHKGAVNARNYSQCDSLLIGDRCGAHTFPDIEVNEPTAQLEHEASTSKIGDDQLFYCQQRGITPEDATNMIVNGFCKKVFLNLPMEFAVEAQKLLAVSLNLEGTVG